MVICTTGGDTGGPNSIGEKIVSFKAHQSSFVLWLEEIVITEAHKQSVAKGYRQIAV